MPEPIKADPSASPLRCPKCGSNRFTVPDHSTNDSLVTCTDCGDEVGRWGDIRVGILEEAKAVAQTERRTKRRRAAA
jgi:DNA-directed RNA polymerase subunit RPC12/RpoP